MAHAIPTEHSQFLVAVASWAGICNQLVVNNSLFQVELLNAKGTMGYEYFTSYNAPWEADTCQPVVATTGMYEAAVNITWLDARQRTKVMFDLLLTTLAWSTVHDIYKRHFSTEAGGLGGVTPELCQSLVFPRADSWFGSGC